MNIKEEIIQATAEYFNDAIDYAELKRASDSYKNLLLRISDDDLNNEDGRTDLEFLNGKAIGPYWAALCVDDLIRTRQFIRGIDEALKDKLSTNDKIHILYAGTGPFATLLLPILFRYPPDKIKYTFLEINQYSHLVLKRILSGAGFDEFNVDLLNEDATKFKFGDDKPDIIVSETMQNALAKEQQVPIFMNFINQSDANTVLIPEKVEISVGLKQSGVPIEKISRKHYQKINKVFELSREAILNSDSRKKLNESEFPLTITTLSDSECKNAGQIVLLTEIQVYKNEHIRITESGLTTPIIIDDISSFTGKTVTIKTQYKIGNEPKLDFQFI